MKKFKFPLESVLKVRGLHKKMAERQLAQTQNKVHQTESAIQETRDEFNQSFHFLAAQTENRAFWHELTHNYQVSLKNHEKNLAERQQQLKEQLEADKQVLSRRMREEKAIEKLKDYQKQRHDHEMEGKIQREIEEIDLLKRGGSK